MSYETWKVGQKVEQAPQPPEQTPCRVKRLYTRQQKVKYFLIGFLGWFLINILLWRLILPVPFSQLPGYQAGEGVLFCLTPILLGANIFVLILMAFVNRWVALGIVAAFAVNLLISLLLGVVFNGICWIPFTAPTMD